MKNIIPVIAITGGPGAGKSTCKPHIIKAFESRGFSVLFVPETATELFESGVRIGEDGVDELTFQIQQLKMQLEKEHRYYEILSAVKNPKKLLLTDRGTMDGAAYVPPGMFETVVKDMGLRISELCEERYDGVCHLESAAVGAAKFYTTENNPVRKEKTAAEARKQDLRTRDVWARHPNFKVIESYPDFDQKINLLFTALCEMVDIPAYYPGGCQI